MRLTLTRHEKGVATAAGNRVVYDVARDEAYAGTAAVTGRVVVQRLPHAHDTAVASEENAYRERIAGQPRSGGVELFG